jgi:hypothetical protein
MPKRTFINKFAAFKSTIVFGKCKLNFTKEKATSDAAKRLTRDRKKRIPDPCSTKATLFTEISQIIPKRIMKK